MTAIASTKTTAQHFVVDPDGNLISAAQPPGQKYIVVGLPSGGQVKLSQQNVTDLLPHLTNFSNTGTYS